MRVLLQPHHRLCRERPGQAGSLRRLPTEDDIRILVTGSRDWTDEVVIVNALDDAIWNSEVNTNNEVTVVSGACPSGADALAEQVARDNDMQVERHPAQWHVDGKYDRSAGFKRNAEMVALGADLCLAFILNGSRGATHTANLAEKAGIPTRRYTNGNL